MSVVNPRVRAVHDLGVAEAREVVGLHEYDGVVQDLSPAGVAAGLARLGSGPPERDARDEEHLRIFEAGVRAWFGVVEEHRRNPILHIGNLDLACYDREYAPAGDRADARRRHLAAWPDAVDAAVGSLDRVPAQVAAALLPAARGLAAGLDPDTDGTALGAHGRLLAHLERAAAEGPPATGIGARALSLLMADSEGLPVELGRLAARTAREVERLTGLLDDACGRSRPAAEPGVPVSEVIRELLSDHPGPDGIAPAARELMAEAGDFCRKGVLLPDIDGECLVGPAPESRRWAMAMMSWAAPYEPDAPSWYHVTPPDPSWPATDQEEWMAVFSRTTLPAITVHEVTPGHFAHGRILRRLEGDVRRGLLSGAFVEGWAHYAEELMLEEGFRADDPRFCIGVCLEALVRATRLQVAIGIHSGDMTEDDATHLFEVQAHLQGPAARAEAARASYDPTYGRYTWGKLEIMALRDEAMAAWGHRYSHLRFHRELLDMGAPPLGLIGAVVGP